MKRILQISLILSIFITFTGCEKALEAYLGFPLQPKNIDAEFTPGLNIFGMLKAGPSLDTLNHIFEVQLMQHVTDTDALKIIYDANIKLTRLRANLPPMEYDLYSLENGDYTNPFLNPQAGDIWNYTCVYDTFLITSQTRIPNEPQIDPNSVKFSDGNIQLTLLPDTSAFMYDVYFIYLQDVSFKRIIPQAGTSTEVTLPLNSNNKGLSGDLFVVAYDANYEKYVTTSNTFFKPNAFRPRFSTVDGGYGCFGSAHIFHQEF